MSEWDCNLLTNLIVIPCYWTNARSCFPWEVIFNLNPVLFFLLKPSLFSFIILFNDILAQFFLVYAQYSNVSEVENCVHFYFISSTQYRYAFRLFKNEQYACFHLKVWFTSLPHDTSLIQKKKIELTPRSKSTKQTGLWESHLWSTGYFVTDDTVLVSRLWPVLTKIFWSSQKKKSACWRSIIESNEYQYFLKI